MTEAATATLPGLPGGEPLTPVSELYKWSAWAHVGPGAEACEAVQEEKGVNDCSNPLHFHAFCRLPNPFAHREIRKRALAAKARHVRLLRDSDSDDAVILEDEMDRIARGGDLAKPALLDELVGQDWWRDFLEATSDIKLHEDDGGTQPFEFIDEDVREYQRLTRDKEEGEEDSPAAARLESHIADFNKRVDARQEELSSPRRIALEARDLNDLIDMVRDQRIDVASNEAFGHEYAACQWLLCTFVKPGGEPVWPSREAMERADGAVLEALKAIYRDLEKTQQQGGGPGNS